MLEILYLFQDLKTENKIFLSDNIESCKEGCCFCEENYIFYDFL